MRVLARGFCGGQRTAPPPVDLMGVGGTGSDRGLPSSPPAWHGAGMEAPSPLVCRGRDRDLEALPTGTELVIFR